jgi:hypothetical protein
MSALSELAGFDPLLPVTGGCFAASERRRAD